MLSAGEFRVKVIEGEMAVSAGSAAGALLGRGYVNRSRQARQVVREQEAAQRSLKASYVELIRLVDGLPVPDAVQHLEKLYPSELIIERLNQLNVQDLRAIEGRLVDLSGGLSVQEQQLPYSTLHMMVRLKKWHWSDLRRATPGDLLGHMMNVPGLMEVVIGIEAGDEAFPTPREAGPYKDRWSYFLRREAVREGSTAANMADALRKTAGRIDQKISVGRRWVFGGGTVSVLFAADVGTRIYTGGRSLPQVVLGIGE